MQDLYIISGMTGMTGNELARQLVKRKNFVIGFDNFFASSIESIKDFKENEKVYFFESDINVENTYKELDYIIERERENYKRLIYINCAAVVHTEYFYEVESTFQTNVLGMKKFLDHAVEHQADIYINCSTSEVYSMDSWKEGGVKEDDFLLMATAEHSQRTSYAVGKLLTEFFLKDCVDKKKIKGCSLRFANVYSNNELYPKHIIPHIITSLIEKGEVTLLENSKVNKRTFLHNYDSCSSILELVAKEESLDGTVYNVATEEEVSITELVKICAEELGIQDFRINFSGYRTADPERRVLSTTKIREKTGWYPSITLREGIKMCVENKKDKP